MVLNKANNYYDAFTAKDINGLKKMFQDNIEFRDWENVAVGVKKVIKIFQDRFDAIGTLVANPLEFYITDHSVVIAEVEIYAGDETVRLVDVIEFDKRTEKIKKIRSYKG
jgi:hypothetical protein